MKNVFYFNDINSIWIFWEMSVSIDYKGYQNHLFTYWSNILVQNEDRQVAINFLFFLQIQKNVSTSFIIFSVETIKGEKQNKKQQGKCFWVSGVLW